MVKNERNLCAHRVASTGERYQEDSHVESPCRRERRQGPLYLITTVVLDPAVPSRFYYAGKPRRFRKFVY